MVVKTLKTAGSIAWLNMLNTHSFKFLKDLTDFEESTVLKVANEKAFYAAANTWIWSFFFITVV